MQTKEPTSWVETRFLPNRKTLSEYYRPQQDQLPPGDLKILCFDFENVATLDTGEQSQPFEKDFVVWGITGGIVNLADPAAQFRVQLFHAHAGKQRALFGKPQLNVNCLGSGQLPVLLRTTYLFTPGDSLLCEVNSLSANAASSRIQVVLWGTEVAPL